MSECVSEWLSDWMSEWVIKWSMSECVINWLISKLYKSCNALTVSWNLIKIILSDGCQKKIFRIYATKIQMQQNIYVHVHCIKKTILKTKHLYLMYICLSKINVSIYFITYLHGQSVVVIAFHPWVLFFEYQHCHFGRLVNQLKLQFIHCSFTPHIKIYIMIVTINKNIDLHCKFWNYIENYFFLTFTCRL